LFSLLAVTGLRISEALALRLGDVTADGLVIRTTKFHKSRLCCLHPSTQAGLERYLKRRRRFAGSDDHIFISRRNRALHYQTVRDTFRYLVDEIGLQVSRVLGPASTIFDTAGPFGRCSPVLPVTSTWGSMCSQYRHIWAT